MSKAGISTLYQAQAYLLLRGMWLEQDRDSFGNDVFHVEKTHPFKEGTTMRCTMDHSAWRGALLEACPDLDPKLVYECQ